MHAAWLKGATQTRARRWAGTCAVLPSVDHRAPDHLGDVMLLAYRIKRGLKELGGWKQWPLRRPCRITNRDEFFLSHLIRPNDVIFDIGANHGALACFMAGLCGVNGKVVAFEPVWRTYERMCERLQAESIERAPIITVPLGLSDEPEVVEIHLPDGLDALASIATREQVNRTHSPACTRSLHCGVITLDLFARTTGVQQPQLVKIYVEGAECKVLRGGRSVWEHAERPHLPPVAPAGRGGRGPAGRPAPLVGGPARARPPRDRMSA